MILDGIAINGLKRLQVYVVYRIRKEVKEKRDVFEKVNVSEHRFKLVNAVEDFSSSVKKMKKELYALQKYIYHESKTYKIIIIYLCEYINLC